MSSEDRRFARHPNPVQENGAGLEGDDEFGDFEGFEGAALDSIPAAAGPSPWATFPDLLPVQTSPATTGNDESCSSLQIARGAESHDHEPWLAGASNSNQRVSVELLPNVAHDGAHGHFSQPRTINPPDVSLSAYQPAYNSVTEQACGSGLSLGQSVEEGLPEMGGGQVANLQRLLDAATQQKHQIQQHLDQLAREKMQLQQQLSTSQAEGTQLRAQVVELQQQLVHLSSNNPSVPSQEIVSTLQQSQDNVMKEMNGLGEALNEMRMNVEEKITVIQKDISEVKSNLEKQQIVEETGKFESVVANVVQKCFQENLECLSQTVANSLSEVVRSQVSPNQDGVVHNFQKELQRHVDQTRRLLERERQQNLLSLAQGLQAALKQFSATIEPTVNDHNEASGDENS